MTDMTDHLKIARDGAVLTATLARPDKKNALTGAMYDALRQALNDADADASVGAVLIAGEGGAFTAGGRTFKITYLGGDGNDVALTSSARGTLVSVK